jgi:putative transposase
MVQYKLKLKLTKIQETKLNMWLWNLTGVYNWAIRKIKLDVIDHNYYSQKEFQNLLANHSDKLDIPSHVIQGTLSTAYSAWKRCFKKLAKEPKLKGNRNKLNSIPFPDPIKSPVNFKIKLPGLREIRYHKQNIPDGKVKCGRILKKASGWYLCLFIDTNPKPIPRISDNKVGIDPRFNHLLTLSNSEKIDHPRELENSLKRIGQAQRGKNKKLAARLHEKIANQRRDRNHKLSRNLLSENSFIAFSKDNIRGISKKFGKSVSSSGHGQLRQMLKSKSSYCGAHYVEVNSKNSTKCCCVCGSMTGPTGLSNLAVRLWVCEVCGTVHDRDTNAAVNTLIAGLGDSHETLREGGPKLYTGSCINK